MLKKNNHLIDIPLLIVAFIFIIDQVFSIYLKKELLYSFQKNSKEYYSLSIERLQFHLLSRSLLAEGITLSQPGIKQTSIKSNLKIGAIDLSDLLWNKKIDVGSINLYNSEINFRGKESDSATDPVKGKLTVYDLFKDKYSSLHAKEINIDNAKINYFRNNTDSIFMFSTSDGAIRVRNFLIDSATTYLQNKPFAADSFDIFMKDIVNTLGDSLYTLTIPSFLLSYTKKVIYIDSLSIKPNYSRNDFFKKVGHQDDRFEVFAGKILLDSIDVKRFLENFECNTADISVDSLHINVYRNKYYKPIIKNKLFLQEIISNLNMPLKIQEMNITHSYVQYEELIPPAHEAGKIFFSEINANIRNLSNHDYDKNELMIFTATAKMNGKSPLTTKVEFPLDNPFFSGETLIKEIEMSNLNSMLEPEVGVTITNGIIDSLKFSIQADKGNANGNIKMVYHDLRVTGKNVEKNDTTNFGLKVKGFVANNFIIKDSNPGKNGEIRQAKMSRPYDNQKFIFNNLYKTLMVGIKKTII